MKKTQKQALSWKLERIFVPSVLYLLCSAGLSTQIAPVIVFLWPTPNPHLGHTWKAHITKMKSYAHRQATTFSCSASAIETVTGGSILALSNALFYRYYNNYYTRGAHFQKNMPDQNMLDFIKRFRFYSSKTNSAHLKIGKISKPTTKR